MNTEKRNYQREMDAVIARCGAESDGEKPRLLLHSCCGPCSSSVLEDLARFFRVTLFWYNPNIFPREEFDRRLAAQKKLLQAMDPSGEIALLEVPFDPEPWYRAVAGLEGEPEGGRRCTACFRLRLCEAARAAAEGGFDWFCSTLTLSRHKDPVRINALGEQAAGEVGVRWLPSEFKKHGRELRSKELCELYGIYRQNYCGCEFSLSGSRGGISPDASADP